MFYQDNRILFAATAFLHFYYVVISFGYIPKRNLQIN